MDKGKQILVTGASGFIGAQVCVSLLASGYRVRAIVRQDFDTQDHCNLQQFVGDLLDPDSLFEACAGIDIVIHLAGLAHANGIKRERLIKVNVYGTELLLAAAINQSVKRFVLLSSSLAASSDEGAQKITSYGESKRGAEELVLLAHNSGSIDAVILRPVNVYGPAMHGNIATLVRLVSGGFVPPFPKLDTRISLIGVRDLSEVIKLSIDSQRASGNTYFVTDGQQYLINDIEKEIYRAVGRKIPDWKPPHLLLYAIIATVELLKKALAFFGIRPTMLSGLSMRTYHNLVNDNVFDNQRAVKDLGFKPSSSFYDSLPEIVDAIKRINGK